MKNLYTAVIPGGCTSLIQPCDVGINWVGFNSRWGSIVSIFVFDWGSINIFMGWGCNQEWGSNRADTVIRRSIRYLREIQNGIQYSLLSITLFLPLGT